MIKNMFGGEMKSKKEQKNLENVLKTIISSTKEKTKNEACLKLIEIFENSLEININFDYLLSSIEDLSECNNQVCRKIWLQLAMQIIKFRSDYRTKLFNKMMKIVFELKNEDNALKIRAIHCASNCCMNIQDLDIRILMEFLTFECLLAEEFQKENVFVMVLNLIKIEFSQISKFLIEFIMDCLVLICLKHYTFLREITDPTIIEEEKKLIKTIFQYFEFYMNHVAFKKNSIIKNIVLIYCFFVNYEREYCWKQMKSFLQSEPNKIVKYFLEIIYNEGINNTFSGLSDYFYYDNDEEFGLQSYLDKIRFFDDSYITFLKKLSDVNTMLIKHKIKIIKGAIFFIGMSIWGYERIEAIYIPNTIILSHFLKLINNSHKKIDQEIILCLRRLIKKYGETLSDEWNEILKVISNIISRDKNTFSDYTIKNLLEILDSIKMLIISNKFYGNVSSFAQILDEFKILQNESLILLKSKLKLSNYCLFIANLESIIIECLLNSKSERVRNYIMEIIRLNYSFAYNKNQSMKKNIIENLICKHFTSLVFSFELPENLNFFSHLITEMCHLTSDIKFFDKIIRFIFVLHSEYKFYSNESERMKYIWNFQKNTLINIYNKLSTSFQSEKIISINKKIYSFMKNKSDISLLIIILNFFKNFIINKDYELFLQDNLVYRNRNLPSQIVINYNLKNLTKKNKKVYENFKTKKINAYEPYIVFKHNKVFDFLMNLINQDETNTFICEEVLDFLAIHLRTTFFYKGLKLDKLLNTIVGIEDIKKYATRKRFIDLLIEILTNSTYHLNCNSLGGSNKDNKDIYNSPKSNLRSSIHTQQNIEITDDYIKEKIIQFSLNSLKSFNGILKNMINSYRKIVMTNIQQQNALISVNQSTKSNSDNKSELTITSNFNVNVNINLVTESSDSTNVYNPHFVNLKMVVYYIKKILNLISIYFASVPDAGESFLTLLNVKNVNNFYYGTGHNSSSSNNINSVITSPSQNKKMSEFVTSFIEILFDMRNFVYFKPSIAISILHLIISIKDILVMCGEDTILKIIYLAMNIGWLNSENEILKAFSDNFNFKMKKFEAEKIHPKEKFMKKEYVNLLTDICCFYFTEKSSQGRNLLNTFSSIFKFGFVNKTPNSIMRENIFMELSKWQVLSKTNRDNLKAEYRSKISQHSQIYLGKQSIIMIIPTNLNTSELIIRNSISNINMSVTANLDPNLSQQCDAVDLLSNVINKKPKKSNSTHSFHSDIPVVNIQRAHSRHVSSMIGSSNLLSSTLNHDEEDNEEFSLKNVKMNFTEGTEPNNAHNNNHNNNSNKITNVYDIKYNHQALKRRDCSPNLTRKNSRPSKVSNSGTMLPRSVSPIRNESLHLNSAGLNVYQMTNNANIILQQLTGTICEQDFKFQMLEHNTQLEDYLKSLDNTPVFYTFNCGVIYVPPKNFISEFDILTYEGEVSQSYIKFLSSLGKVFSVVENKNIYTGGLCKTGEHGKYAIYHQDNLFQLVFHVSNLIKIEAKSSHCLSDEEKDLKEHLKTLNNVRKKLLGNDYVNIVWLDNPNQDFDSSIIISGAILIYLVIYPISECHYLVKIKHNKRSKFNLLEKVSTYFMDDFCVNVDNDNLSKYLIRMSIQLNLLISYILQKTVFKKVEIERQINMTGSSNNKMNLQNQIHFDTNISQRYKEIERINYRFKNSI